MQQLKMENDFTYFPDTQLMKLKNGKRRRGYHCGIPALKKLKEPPYFPHTKTFLASSECSESYFMLPILLDWKQPN